MTNIAYNPIIHVMTMHMYCSAILKSKETEIVSKLSKGVKPHWTDWSFLLSKHIWDCAT